MVFLDYVGHVMDTCGLRLSTYATYSLNSPVGPPGLLRAQLAYLACRLCPDASKQLWRRLLTAPQTCIGYDSNCWRGGPLDVMPRKQAAPDPFGPLSLRATHSHVFPLCMPKVNVLCPSIAGKPSAQLEKHKHCSGTILPRTCHNYMPNVRIYYHYFSDALRVRPADAWQMEEIECRKGGATTSATPLKFQIHFP